MTKKQRKAVKHLRKFIKLTGWTNQEIVEGYSMKSEAIYNPFKPNEIIRLEHTININTVQKVKE